MTEVGNLAKLEESLADANARYAGALSEVTGAYEALGRAISGGVRSEMRAAGGEALAAEARVSAAATTRARVTEMIGFYKEAGGR